VAVTSSVRKIQPMVPSDAMTFTQMELPAWYVSLSIWTRLPFWAYATTPASKSGSARMTAPFSASTSAQMGVDVGVRVFVGVHVGVRVCVDVFV